MSLSEKAYRGRMEKLRIAWREQGTGIKTMCHTSRYQNRCKLLLKHDDMCWVFLKHNGVPLTNNEAERSLRSYVLWRKGSYGVWSTGERIIQTTHPHYRRNLPEAKAESADLDSGNPGCNA